MCTIALIFLIGVGGWLAVDGTRQRKFGLTGAGILLAVAAGVFFGLLDFWGEMLWFEAMGYGRRFWEAVWVRVLAGMAGALIGAAFVALLTFGVPPGRRLVRIAVVVISGLIS